jgi:hypothetical protein
MALLRKTKRRADSARNNGAKSSGATTPEGLDKARNASVTHGLYATEETLKATVDPVAFDALREKYRRCWQPEDEYADDRVDDLVQARWDLNRLQLVRRNELTSLFQQTGNVSDAEAFASEPNSLVARLEARIRHIQRLISRLERDIYALDKKPKASQIDGPSQESMKTKDVPDSLACPPKPEGRRGGTTEKSAPEQTESPAFTAAPAPCAHPRTPDTAPSS